MAFIGTGKMAQAMINPLVKMGYQPENKVAIYDVSTEAMNRVKKDFPAIQTAKSIEELLDGADFVVCAVKPQNLNDKFFAQFPQDIREDATLLSILAGKPMEAFDNSGFRKIVRSMPNTPATIGKGMTVWSCTSNLTADDRERVKMVLDTFGKSVSIPCVLRV